MKRNFFANLSTWLMVVLLFSTSFLFAEATNGEDSSSNLVKTRVRTLKAGSVNEIYSLMEIPVGITQKQFEFKIPKDCFGFKVALREATGDLDLKVGLAYKEGNPMLWKEAKSEEWNEVLFWDRLDNSGVERAFEWQSGDKANLSFVDGRAVVSVFVAPDYLESFKALTDEEQKPLSFFLSVEWLQTPPISSLFLNQYADFTLNTENQFRVVYSLNLDIDSSPLLISWKGKNSGIKLLIKYKNVAWKEADADYLFDVGELEQDFILNKDVQVPLKKGKWFFTLLSSGEVDGETVLEGSLLVKWLRKDGIQLKPISALPIMQGNEIENCMSAVVGITSSYRTVCGVFISEQGHILTSLSGISDSSNRVAGELSVCISTSVNEDPIYAFTASLVSSDPKNDLALLELKSGAYGRSIPSTFTFPYLKVAKSLNVETGQPINIMDFPLDRISGKASTIVSSREIVGGFEKANGKNLFKASSMIGGAGGIAINVYNEVIGVNSIVPNKKNDTSIVYFAPTEKIPENWLAGQLF